MIQRLSKTKSALPLLVAAFALAMIGLTFDPLFSLPKFLAVGFVCLQLVLLVYSLNDIFDDDLKVSLPLAWRKVRNTFALLLLGLALFLGLQVMSVLGAVACLGVIAIGAFYSTPLFSKCSPRFGEDAFLTKKVPFARKPKDVLYLKNLLIALGWSLLPFIAVDPRVLDSQSGMLLLNYSVFIFVQVFIGSSIRDIQDIEEDLVSDVHTLANTWGVERSLKFLRVLNFSSLALPGILFFIGIPSFWFLSLVVVYRECLLGAISRNPRSIFLIQTANLATCVLILFSRLLESFWGGGSL